MLSMNCVLCYDFSWQENQEFMGLVFLQRLHTRQETWYVSVTSPYRLWSLLERRCVSFREDFVTA